ncbi:hypothetical protein [Staphylococcus hominis]
MSIIKSYSVGNGDMFYIEHNSDNFSIIDCCLNNQNQEKILDEILKISKRKGIVRFISTHPDEDHIQGLELLNNKLNITNFYCVRNNAKKENYSISFEEYKKLRDSNKAFYIKKNSQRKWMNQGDEVRGSAGINILWPDESNIDFKKELQKVENKESANDISAIIQYKLSNGITALWLGDLTTEFMEKIENKVNWGEIDLLFAPHHSRKSGRVPTSILSKLNPKLIVVGEGSSKDLYYYSGYSTITQNKSGNIVFDCVEKDIHVYVSEFNYINDHLQKRKNIAQSYEDLKYIGSIYTHN